MVRNKIMFNERLYLSKEENAEVYVDICQLPQHQIEGIRFLYAQYKKKKSGVIVNDPSGYGKTLQVVLFLNAVRHLLSAPVLIICHEDDVQNWKDHFNQWTELHDDVAFEFSAGICNKKVYVNTVNYLNTVCRQQWSIIVVDGENFIKNIIQTKFINLNKCYKIWITPNDMKKHLSTLSKIYGWFHQNEKFNEKDFTPDENDVNDVVSKSILLDAFLEDVLIRRNNFTTPFKDAEDIPQSIHEKKTPKITRKNKDATGTKIKRSKRKLEIEIVSTQSKKDSHNTVKKLIAENDHNNEVTPKIENKVIDTNNEELNNIKVEKEDKSQMDVENFIREQKPLESAALEQIMHDYDNISQPSEGNRIKTIDDLQNAINEIIQNENKEKLRESENDTPCNDYKYNDNCNTDVRLVIEDSGGSQDSVNSNHNTNSEMDYRISNKDEKTCLDYKISELEKETLKKFKGSLLDSIF